MYRTIMTELNCSPTSKKKPILLDLCCGTGTLSTLMANQVHHIYAIDSSQSAIDDARANAERNNVSSNITFICDTVDKALPRLDEILKENGNTREVVGVVNPSRRGLNRSVVGTLRRMHSLRTLVYVSCRPEGEAFNNFVQLCNHLPEMDDMMVPVNGIPVDLFPHTEHVELVLTFQRM